MGRINRNKMMKPQKKDNTEIAKTIGRAIARHRKACDLTQEQVANKLNMGYEAVSRMERGIVIPSVERLIELAEIFNCQASEFLSEASIRPTDQAIYFSQMLSRLNDEDRRMSIEIIERLVKRFES